MEKTVTTFPALISEDYPYCTVYEFPSILSGLVTYLKPGDEVLVIEEQSTECYYYILCKDDLFGYCMRPFDKIKDGAE